jgi:hypothetical protein
MSAISIPLGLADRSVHPRRAFATEEPTGGVAMSTVAAPEPWMQPVLDAFNVLLGLKPGWDSYGAPRVKPEAGQAAFDLLRDIMRARTPVPSIVPTADGGVQIEWHIKGVDLQIEVRSPTQITACFEHHASQDNWEKDLAGGLDVRPLNGPIRLLSGRSAR